MKFNVNHEINSKMETLVFGESLIPYYNIFKNNDDNTNHDNNKMHIDAKRKTNINNAEEGICNNKLKIPDLSIQYPCELKPSFLERKLYNQRKINMEKKIIDLRENIMSVDNNICDMLKINQIRNDLKILILNHYVSVMERMIMDNACNKNNNVIPYNCHVNAFES